ncbi:MAG: AAA family ATPase [Lautropia sp.]|nr:AAA family ATPase [Lautropia sp.]
MRLTSIHLSNYRAHVNLSVDFEAGFNLIAGVNGSGKTSLLMAVADSLAGVLSYLAQNRMRVFGARIFDDDHFRHVGVESLNGRIRFEPRMAVLRLTGECAKGTFQLQLTGGFDSPAVEGDNPFAMVERTGDSARLMRGAGGVTDEIPSGTTTIMPVIAFYRANRRWSSKSVDPIKAATIRPARADGYEDWKEAGLGSESLQTWVIAKSLERLERVAQTGQRLNEVGDDELALVNMALNQSFTEFSGLRYDMQQKSLLVECSEESAMGSIPFAYLSDGQRAVICLIADIARRMCLLNPQLGNRVTQQTPGVILIDELDVHLHPAWQRRIVNGLKAAFPKVQFIATSHSPQILGELRPCELILLQDGEGQDGVSRPRVSYGLDSSQILAEIMGAPQRNEEVQKRLDTLFAQIETGPLQQARKTLEDLKADIQDVPELSGAEALIRRKELIGR